MTPVSDVFSPFNLWNYDLVRKKLLQLGSVDPLPVLDRMMVDTDKQGTYLWGTLEIKTYRENADLKAYYVEEFIEGLKIAAITKRLISK